MQKKKINYNTKVWQEWKMKQPNVSGWLKSALIGMIISDATIALHGKYAYVKFEQSKEQYFFIYHLFYIFKQYTFLHDIGVRFNKDKTIKSFYFKTYSHPTFLDLYNIFYINGKKTITLEVLQQIDEVVLAYWIMGDGSMNKRDNRLVLHTESFGIDVNTTISEFLNKKYGLHTYLTKSYGNNKMYSMINIPYKDRNFIINSIRPHILSEFLYKVSYSKKK